MDNIKKVTDDAAAEPDRCASLHGGDVHHAGHLVCDDWRALGQDQLARLHGRAGTAARSSSGSTTSSGHSGDTRTSSLIWTATHIYRGTKNSCTAVWVDMIDEYYGTTCVFSSGLVIVGQAFVVACRCACGQRARQKALIGAEAAGNAGRPYLTPIIML